MFGPRKVIHHIRQPFITIPKALARQLEGKYVMVKLEVIDKQ